ncbi:TPA: 50S ribosomal protein L13 [Candidatus Peribacteria bacterium]|nr:MAG: 50S ribosomal protein L13 [Candidatus Peribacteria bacterium RIFOXYC2_FULL_58_10]OGJ84952.1 MAG: 50S ribosomal protein L13 [Candidatus Peribacteria bacterium RIFOXYD2_FULL_58_15]HAI98972.1 50S ribosomal protein L13 [Candidatus Peribacteria bacterium]HAS34777.1 50S ribosomal protein L13 [Candidatus Peribacteria bacterium]
MKTSVIPPSAPKWHLIDADGKSLGRLAVKVSTVLRGKHRASYSPHQLCGDHVIVINAAKLGIHPTKLYRKTYVKHTGYLGHIHTSSLKQMMERDPVNVIERAVKGMLPVNRLRPQMLKRLHVFADALHGHEAQKPAPLSLS